VFELARRVQRIDVDHRVAGAQDGRNGDRILQHVRHHDGHARARLQATALQPGAQALGIRVDFGIGEVFVHADIRIAVGVLVEGLFQQLHQRTVLTRIDSVCMPGGYDFNQIFSILCLLSRYRCKAGAQCRSAVFVLLPTHDAMLSGSTPVRKRI
jgi:hypothetical protein